VLCDRDGAVAQIILQQQIEKEKDNFCTKNIAMLIKI
jgi:hypothetical protein